MTSLKDIPARYHKQIADQILPRARKGVMQHSNVRSGLDNATARGTLSDLGPKPSKYRNMKRLYVSRQGFEIVAASIKEARGYGDLDTFIGSGDVIRWVPQVSFLLQGGSRYRADALIWWKDGSVTVLDYKGVETDVFRIKRALMKSTYGLEIEIVK